MGVFGRAGVVRYDDVLSVKDVDQVLITGTAARVVGASERGTFGASVLFGRDWAVESDSRYSRDIFGARVESGWIFSEEISGRVSLGAVRSNYDEVFFPDDFDSPRDDTLLQAAATVSWRISPAWVLLPTLAWYENDSDVDIFVYDRLVVDLRIQRVWN